MTEDISQEGKPPKISLRGVAMRFGDFYAVKDIDLDIRDGEYVTILGPSGCGKTTLIKTVSGIWKPTEGRVFIDGEDVTDVDIEDRDVGYVFQNIALFPNMDNLSNVQYGPRVKGMPKEERDGISNEYLALVKMLDRAGMLPSELSGGEMQKVAIARALSSGSKVLMLDEPLSALDTRVRTELRYDIRRIVKKLGITVLHVTHDQEEAMSVSDRIVLMKAGSIHDVGTPMDLYRSPTSIFAANFIGETNLLEGFVSGFTRKGRTMVHLRSGKEVRAEKTELPVGEAVVISCRPENVYPAKKGLSAEVLSVVFMGTYWRVRTLAETQDYIEYNVSSNLNPPEEGQEVFLVFNKKMTKVFIRPKEGLEEAIRLE